MMTSTKCISDEPLFPSGSRISDITHQVSYSVGQFKTFPCAEAVPYLLNTVQQPSLTSIFIHYRKNRCYGFHIIHILLHVHYPLFLFLVLALPYMLPIVLFFYCVQFICQQLQKADAALPVVYTDACSQPLWTDWRR